MSRELLKEAIADAKAVKEAAIANAKAALEEAFTPHLKELLASKLESLEESEGMAEMKNKYNMEEGDYVEEDDYGTKKDPEELNLEEILAELEGDDINEGDDYRVYEAEKEKSKDDKSEEEDSKGDESEELGDKKKIEAMIKKVIDDMIEAGELEAGEGESEEGEPEEGEGSMEDLEADVMGGEGEEGAEELEEIDLEELMLEMKMEKEKSMNEMQGGAELLGALQIFAGILGGGTLLGMLVGYLKRRFPEFKEKIEAIGAAAAGGSSKIEKTLGAQEQGDVVKMDEMRDELDEAYSTIKTLRSELNEVNLLNAKLLYTNKIFKAKNLTESQKVKVLSTFDKATTVKEVKLVFESLNTSISTSNNTVKAPIKESMGFASKASGIVKNNQTIETDAVIARMKKLAGL